MKRRMTIALILLLIFLPPASGAHAHSIKIQVSGGESVGWSVDEKYHTNGTNVYYKLDATDKYISDYKQIITDGAALWKGTVSISASTSAIGTFKTYYNPNDRAVAKFINYKSDSSGHLTSWEIWINRAHTTTKLTIAHEPGHAIGLNDLYSSYNKDMLMFGYTNSTAKSPTAVDIMGAKVITGSHSTHTWGYRYYEQPPTSKPVIRDNKHQRYCSVCWGVTGEIETCIYVNGVCKKCRVPKGAAPYGVIEIM